MMTTIDRQRGVSLYTLLAAVVVLSLLSAVIVTQFRGTHSKAAAVWTMMQTMGSAAEQFHMDTGCFPKSVKALWDYDATSQNSCGLTIPYDIWHGPYIKPMSISSDGADSAHVHQFGPKAYIRVHFIGGRPVVRAAGLPKDIAQAAFALCGGSKNPACSNSNAHSAHKYTLIYYYAPGF